jgi:LPS export ABC transporter protein LptC
MKSFRPFLGLIILGCVVGVGVLVWRTMKDSEQKKEPTQESSASADLMLDRVHYIETREGVKEWELEAASARFYKDKNIALLENVKATYFGKNQESYVLVGKKGKFNTQTKNIEVFDDVRIDSSDGYHMRTQSLWYQTEKKELSTGDWVEVRGPQLRMEGIGLVVDLERQRVKILHQVITTLFPMAQKEP